jgi:hypothetical protein
MADKIRKQIYIEASQEARLKELTARTGESEAALIRQAIDQLFLAEPRIRRPVGNPASWHRAIQTMHTAILEPRPGMNPLDRDAMHD